MVLKGTTYIFWDKIGIQYNTSSTEKWVDRKEK